MTAEHDNNNDITFQNGGPKLYEFIDSLLKEELYAEGRRRSVDLGNAPPRKKRKYQQNDARIEQIVRRYEDCKAEQVDLLDDDWENGTLKYLRTIGHSARGNFV